MKHRIISIVAITILAACNNGPADNYDLSDSLGRKRTDTSSRRDTAYYERLQHRPGAGDSTAANNRRRNDTAYYERLPNKPPDSTR